MNPTDIIYEMQLAIFEAFKSQDPDLFDVAFEVEGKKIYAEKLRLSLTSSTFKSMLSDQWASKNDAIKIESYKFEDFKEFLSFLYCGKCSLTDENIFAMLDISEFYQVNSLKKLCDEYLSKMKYNLDNVFQLLETSNRYLDLIRMKKSVNAYIYKNFSTIVKSDEFLQASKVGIEEFVTSQPHISKQEELFRAVYEWAERQALKKEEESNDESFNINDAIKAEMLPFLPYIKFKQMESKFVIKYVVKRGFLFSYDELSDILDNVRSNVKVKITNSGGQSISGILALDNNATEVIKSLKNSSSANPELDIDSFFAKSFPEKIWWETKCKIPSTPSPLKKRRGVEWYLTYFQNGNIGVKRWTSITEKDYLLAEMAEIKDVFRVTPNCKISIN